MPEIARESAANENRKTCRECTPDADANTAVDHLAPLLRDKLDASERDDLERMLEAVAVIRGGPIEAQERFIARTVRVLAEQH
ncbi:hypothetical protein [Methylorubrum extorquens]|uniref:Uncharacterized protein n=1 Tax=Methylorubrum extorquens (strain CM4 / NCIMB 13688) TaxID=440085 RepID=B7KRB2_METC4|nr:hypothetical protein [Methylorubrum extorquens]ACK83848.1 hypothetical protein Mchl_3010 [Methylorubrum extorquens CM4]